MERPRVYGTVSTAHIVDGNISVKSFNKLEENIRYVYFYILVIMLQLIYREMYRMEISLLHENCEGQRYFYIATKIVINDKKQCLNVSIEFRKNWRLRYVLWQAIFSTEGLSNISVI